MFNNYEIAIYEQINNISCFHLSRIKPITDDIDNAFKLGYIDLETKLYMLDYINSQVNENARLRSMIHAQRMYEFQEFQKHYQEQQEIMAL